MSSKKRQRKIERQYTKPERDQKKVKSFRGPGKCRVCGMPLFAGGCAGTGMCGPCCTGESDTVGEF